MEDRKTGKYSKLYDERFKKAEEKDEIKGKKMYRMREERMGPLIFLPLITFNTSVSTWFFSRLYYNRSRWLLATGPACR